MGLQFSKRIGLVAVCALSLMAVNVSADAPDGAADEATTEARMGYRDLTDGAFDDAPSIERASGERLATAMGRYARARSLLIEAIHEFDRATKVARPDALLDSAEWRSNLVARAEELQRVLAPQPRATKSGVKFEADTRLLNVKRK